MALALQPYLYDARAVYHAGYMPLDKGPVVEDEVILKIARERRCCSRRVRVSSSVSTLSVFAARDAMLCPRAHIGTLTVQLTRLHFSDTYEALV